MIQERRASLVHPFVWMRFLAVAAGSTAVLFSVHARADDKKSATFDLSGGPSIVHVEGKHGASIGAGGFAFEAIGLGVGFFVQKNFSVTFRASHMFIVGGKHIAFHGASVQWYVYPRVFCGLGPGLVTYGGPGAFAAQASGHDDRSGFGMHVRAGATVLDGRRHAVQVYLQMYPAFFKDGTVVATGLGIEWQMR
jgi:hypothetical protein